MKIPKAFILRLGFVFYLTNIQAQQTYNVKTTDNYRWHNREWVKIDSLVGDTRTIIIDEKEKQITITHNGIKDNFFIDTIDTLKEQSVRRYFARTPDKYPILFEHNFQKTSGALYYSWSKAADYFLKSESLSIEKDKD